MFLNFVNRLDQALRLLSVVVLTMVLLYPLLPAFFYENPANDLLAMLPSGSFAMVQFWMSRLDAGGQMGLGPWLLRSLALAAVALPAIFPDLQLPFRGRYLLPLLAFHALSFCSAVLSSHPYDAFMDALDSALVSGVAVRSAQLIQARSLPLWLSLIPAVVLFQFPSMFIQFHSHPSEDGQMRGCFHHPNMLATYLMIALPTLVLRSLLDGPSQLPFQLRLRPLYIVVLSLVFSGIALTGSRAAMLTLLIFLAWVVFTLPVLRGQESFSQRRFLLRSMAGVGFALACIMGWLLATRGGVQPLRWLCGLVYLAGLAVSARKVEARAPLILGLCALVAWTVVTAAQANQGVANDLVQRRSQNLVSHEEGSVVSRSAFWRACWLQAADYPLLGVGPGGFHRYYPQYEIDCRWFSKFPHSLPLAVLAENGWPAFLLLCVSLLLTLQLWLRRLQESDPALRGERFAAFAGACAVAAMACFDVQWQFPVLPLTMGFLLGASLSEQNPLQATQLPEEEAPSPWTLRPQVLVNQLLCALLLGMQLVNVRGAEAQYYHEVSRIAMQKKRVRDAIDLARFAIQRNPFSGEYYHQLGLVSLTDYGALKKEEQEALVGVARAACRFDSHRAVHWDLLYKVLAVNKRHDEARAAALHALELDCSNYPSFYQNLAQLDVEKGESSAAVLHLESATLRFPTAIFGVLFDFRAEGLRRQLAEIYSFLAELSEPDKNPQQADAYFVQALKLDPGNSNFLLGRAVAQFTMGKYDQALVLLVELERQGSRYDIVYGMLAQIYRTQKKPELEAQALKKYQQLREKGSNGG